MSDYYNPNAPVDATQIPQQVPPPPLQRTTYRSGAFNLDFSEVLRRAVKYIFEGLAVAFVAYIVARGRLDLKDVVIIGITAAFVFAILDTFSPTVALGVRFGAGFGIGQSLFGVGPLAGVANPVV